MYRQTQREHRGGCPEHHQVHTPTGQLQAQIQPCNHVHFLLTFRLFNPSTFRHLSCFHQLE